LYVVSLKKVQKMTSERTWFG